MANPFSRISSRGAALAALRMSGLPVFLIRAGTLLFVLFRLMVAASENLPLPGYVGAVVIGVCLVGMGLGLRSGRAGLVIPAFVLNVANFVGLALLVAPWSLIVPGMMVLLSLSGVQGWLWLRRNPAPA